MNLTHIQYLELKIGESGDGCNGGQLQHGLFLQSGMSYSDDIHTAHAKSAPHPSWMKSGPCDHSFYKKNNFHGKKVFF